MPSPQTADARGRFLLPLAVLLICAVQIALTFPGELIADSTEQLREAMAHRYGDWHPPVMALVWSWLIRVTGNPGSLLVMQQVLHWLGFGLLADGCYRAGMRKRAWAVVAAGAFPVFLFYDRVIVKDVQMASAYIAAVGLFGRYLLLRRAMPRGAMPSRGLPTGVVPQRVIPGWALLLCGVLLAYGTLARTNAVFALGPILCLLFARGRALRLPALVILSGAVAVLAVPVSNVINHRVIGAADEDAIQSLQIFDMVDIALRSGDDQVIGGPTKAPSLAALRQCYTPYWWDPFSRWGTCARLRAEFDYVSDALPPDPAKVAERSGLWRSAIERHPVDYLMHRLTYFNSSIYFLVPALHFRFSKSEPPTDDHRRTFSPHDIRVDYIKKNLFFWPVFWLTVGCCALALLEPPAVLAPAASLARSLLVSGLLYSAAYVVIGVATDVRYYYWPILCILIAVILMAPSIRLQWDTRRARVATALTVLLVVVVAGYAARLGGIPFG